MYGENQFMMQTPEEFEAINLGFKPYLRTTPFHYEELNLEAPDAVDWRDKGAVSGVKD